MGLASSFFLMTSQQRIDWINYVDEISHRLHELMAICAKLEEPDFAVDFVGIDDALQATKDVLPEPEPDEFADIMIDELMRQAAEAQHRDPDNG
jgi:hypothetical protein